MTAINVTTDRTPERWAAALDATVHDIDRMSMPERLEFLLAMRYGPAVPLGASERWRNLEGVISFFAAEDMGAPGTWVSIVNAGVLEGVERGIAIALDGTADDFGSIGAREWAAYLNRLHAGELSTASVHAAAWSKAKEVGTDYALDLARTRDLTPTPVEERFLRFAQLYNWAMRNRAPFDLALSYAAALHPGLASISSEQVDELFAVGNPVTTQRACEIAYAVAKMDPKPELLAALPFLLGSLPKVFAARGEG